MTGPSAFEPAEVGLLPSPRELLAALPASPAQRTLVQQARDDIRRLLRREDRRLLVVVGPCSIHDVASAREYAQRLAALAAELDDRLLLVMRTYFEKPRTNGGWKGLIPDPRLDGSGDLRHGLELARGLLRDVLALGLPIATEFLDPLVAVYLADLVAWGSIGARTTESQPHRQLASGLGLPIGFKNSTSGSIAAAVHAVKSAAQPHAFVGIGADGAVAAIRTRGNPDCHLVLRGGATGPNFDAEHLASAEAALLRAGLRPAIMVDCNHDNSGRQPERQPAIARAVAKEFVAGHSSIVGLMIESHLHGGVQRLARGGAGLRYGVSVTDPCLDWESTERCLRELHGLLGTRVSLPPGARVVPTLAATGGGA